MIKKLLISRTFLFLFFSYNWPASSTFTVKMTFKISPNLSPREKRKKNTHLKDKTLPFQSVDTKRRKCFEGVYTIIIVARYVS